MDNTKKNVASAGMALALVLQLAAASAQPAANPYNGTWTVNFDGSRTASFEGTVVVQDDGGSWKVVARQQRDPCVGREAPLAVQSATADELVFRVERSKALTGCVDFTLRLKKVDDTTLAGKFADGRAVTLKRN